MKNGKNYVYERIGGQNDFKRGRGVLHPLRTRDLVGQLRRMGIMLDQRIDRL